MGKTVIIDADECIGCESCSEICPEVFGFNSDDEKAFVIKPDGGDVECAEEAASSCPVECTEGERAIAVMQFERQRPAYAALTRHEQRCSQDTQ